MIAADERPRGSVWWLEDALAADRGPRCEPLSGALRADVCIVGGGYTGLWAAIELRERAPDISVVLVERQGCGFGASGRNGGWLTGWHDDLDALIHRFGVPTALQLAERSAWAIRRVVEFAEEHGIACDIRRRGALWAAMAPAQLGAWDGALHACRAHGRGAFLEPVSAEEARQRTGLDLPLGAARQTDAAGLHPARLVRGLLRVAVEKGVEVHEGTAMVKLDRSGSHPVVRTTAGSVEAERVVLATGAFSGAIRSLRRTFVPVASTIVVSEPVEGSITETELGRGELLGDARLMVHYAQLTPSGRIVFGRGGGPIGHFGAVPSAHYHDAAAVRDVTADFRRWFPKLRSCRITHAWSGSVDRTPDHLPFVGELGEPDVLVGLGYSGNGVGPAALIGRLLAMRALGQDDRHAPAVLAQGPRCYLPPEPLRSLGGLAVGAAVRRAEAREERGLRAPVSGAFKPLVAAHVPRILEPRAWGSSRGHVGEREVRVR